MPILKSAIKKLAVDKRRTRENTITKTVYKKAVKLTRIKPTAAALTRAFSALDRAAKKHVIHQNKANRLKSRLSRLLKK